MGTKAIRRSADVNENSAAHETTVAQLMGEMLPPAGLVDARSGTVPWLWQGYLAAGKTTVLTSQWKAGKTTLVSLLLSRLRRGGMLADLPVTPGAAVIVTEESTSDWDARCRHLGIDDGHRFLCRPFKRRPSLTEWLALIDAIATLNQREGVSLAVIDTLAHFLPGNIENTASRLLECLVPLHELAQRGMCVLLNHHPRKGRTLAGQASRGSGALPSFADIVIEMSWFSRPEDADRRRRLRAYSRLAETPRHLVIELSADGRDYARAMVTEADLECWPELEQLLARGLRKMTRQEIRDVWPAGRRKPDPATLWRWLEQGVAQGLLHREGSGKSNEPYRYWLADHDDLVHGPPLGVGADAMQAWNARFVNELLQGRGG
jgi:hypothetical protein